MTSTINGIEFDPGFAPFLLAFRGTAEYLYMDINRFKNFSQKKTKFLQYHKKILEMFNNNLGFYVGCLMWASYIKTQPQQEILSNHCYGLEYNPDENISETRFMLNFVENFPKDMKFFIGQSFTFDENIAKLINIYEEFLILNKGFVETKYNTDIILPSSIKTDNAEGFKAQIEDVLNAKDLSQLVKYIPTII